MAVPEQIPVVNYVADGIVKKFDVPFEYDQQSDLHVYVDGAEPTIDKYFFTDNSFNFYIAPTSGQDVKIKRITPKERDTDYNLHTNTVRPKALNTDFDRLWYVLQEVFSDVGGLSQAVQDEIIARIQGDEDLLNQLTAEISARMLGDEAVTEDLKNYVNQVIGAIINDPDFDGIDADKVNDASGETQQQVNYNGGSKWHSRVGGYKLNERVVLTNGDIVKSTIDGNVTDPNVDMTGWVNTNSASQIFDESGKTQQEINDQWIDATKHLKPGDATHNVTQLRLLIEVAKSQGKGIKHDPTASGVLLNDDIDFSGVRNVRFETAITLPLEKQIVYGGTALSGAISEVYFKSISDGTIAIPARPMLKFNGVKQCRVYVGACNYLQVYADTTIAATNSTAYNVFEFGGIIRKLELTNFGNTGWINENHFYDGRVMQLVIDGKVYQHNHNLFHGTVIEGSTATINITNAWDNKIDDCRMESMPSGSVSFGEGSFNNRIIRSWNGSGSLRANFTNYLVGTNLGRGNIVVQDGAEHYDVTEIFSITPVGIVGNIYQSTSPNPYIGAANESYPSVQLFTPKLNSVAFLGGRFLGLSDLIPVDLNTVFNFRAKYSGSPLRMYVQCFDANKKLITTDIGAVSMYLRSFVAETGYYTNSLNLNAEQLSNGFAIESDQVKYVRVGAVAISSGDAEYLSCQLITQKHGNNLQKPFVQNICETAVINGGITQGYAKKGQKFYDTLYHKDNTCLFDMRVAATAESLAGATSVNIGRAAEVLAGDVIGIQQNDGATRWTKVVSVSGSNITIQNALTDVVSIGNAVVINRWSVLSGFKTFDWSSLASGAVQNTTISVSGATIGKKVDVLFNQPLQGTILYGDVSSDGVVTVYHQNPTAATVDVVSGTLRVVVY